MKNYRDKCQRIANEHPENDQKIASQQKRIKDKRIHLVLFFFDGHRVKDQDLISVKEIQEYTNVIPLISKGDSFMPNELKKVKSEIMNKSKLFDVNFFDINSTI